MKADPYCLKYDILPSIQDLREELEALIEDDPITQRIVQDLTMFEAYISKEADKLEEEDQNEQKATKETEQDQRNKKRSKYQKG